MSLTDTSAIPQGAFLPTGRGQGKTYFVKPRTGGDGASGRTPATAFKTLARALSACVAGQNDVVYLFSEGQAAADTTDYQSATLDWNKDLTHLIGINSGNGVAQRSRVAFLSTYATASNLFTLSANSCIIQDIHFFAGVASALPTGCFNLTGQRNLLRNCHMAGLGNAANDIAGAYSLQLAGAAENVFEDCTIGLDTVTLGAAVNSQILCSGAATRNRFKRCKFLLYTNHATNHVFLRAPLTSLDRWLLFDDCMLINPVDSGSTALTQAFVVVANGGTVLLAGGTGVVGATDWNATDAGNVRAIGGTVTAATYGLGVAVLR